tara:strand:- start:129 stop:440 length:312 start_codon:yes stop_codon:yes gene_type:complete
MIEQEILDNNPDDDGKWTHHTSDNIYLMDKDGRFYFWCVFMEGWESFKGMKVFGVRSRVDIERIAELEKSLDKLINRAQQVDSWESFPDSWLDEAYEALKVGK